MIKKFFVWIFVLCFFASLSYALVLHPSGVVNKTSFWIVCNGDGNYFEIYVNNTLVQNSSFNNVLVNLSEGTYLITCSNGFETKQNLVSVVLPKCSSGTLVLINETYFCVSCPEGFVVKDNFCVPEKIVYKGKDPINDFLNSIIYYLSPNNPTTGFFLLIILIIVLIIIIDSEKQWRRIR
ncbi:MAG: hypothetical protein QXU20_05060 [Candidatus Woesearchaeota archaeon]